jgi:hypothetical protein
VLGEIGLHPHRHLDERVCHHGHSDPVGWCGVVVLGVAEHRHVLLDSDDTDHVDANQP